MHSNISCNLVAFLQGALSSDFLEWTSFLTPSLSTCRVWSTCWTLARGSSQRGRHTQTGAILRLLIGIGPYCYTPTLLHSYTPTLLLLYFYTLSFSHLHSPTLTYTPTHRAASGEFGFNPFLNNNVWKTLNLAGFWAHSCIGPESNCWSEAQ